MYTSGQESRELWAPPASECPVLAHLSHLPEQRSKSWWSGELKPQVCRRFKKHKYSDGEPPWHYSLSFSFLGEHLMALWSLFSESSVRMLSHTTHLEREVADRQMSTSTPRSVGWYPRTCTRRVNGPFFSSSIGWKVFKLWRTWTRPKKNI